MTAKPALPSFQPAPRPQPRTTAAEAQLLQDATRDLGFGRATSTPEIPAAAPASPVEKSARAKPTPTRRGSPSARPVEALKHGPSLKFSIPDDVWSELRMEALKRRVTVRFLVLEALAAKGYAIDLDEIPEDGRRIR